MDLKDKIMLNEITHRQAYQFYVACKTSFKNLLEEDLSIFNNSNLVQVQKNPQDELIIEITKLGNVFCDRITVLITEKKYEFYNDRIYFHEPFFS